MAAAKSHAGLRAEFAHPADSAVGVLIDSLVDVVVSVASLLGLDSGFVGALRVEAWKTLLLSVEATTLVTTSVDLLAAGVEELSALFLSADIVSHGAILHNVVTEAAKLALLELLVLLACLANVVWLGLAVGAEGFFAVAASDSVCSHVVAGIEAHHLALVILGVVVGHSWGHLHDTATWAGG